FAVFLPQCIGRTGSPGPVGDAGLRQCVGLLLEGQCNVQATAAGGKELLDVVAKMRRFYTLLAVLDQQACLLGKQGVQARRQTMFDRVAKNGEFAWRVHDAVASTSGWASPAYSASMCSDSSSVPRTLMATRSLRSSSGTPLTSITSGISSRRTRLSRMKLPCNRVRDCWVSQRRHQ